MNGDALSGEENCRLGVSGRSVVASEAVTLKRSHDVREHLLLVLLTIDVEDQTTPAIEVEKRFGLSGVDLETMCDDLL
jgi:hypothetical protein